MSFFTSFLICLYRRLTFLLQLAIKLYRQGLILRREGRIQDSLDSFQNSYSVNSTNVNNVRQIAKSLYVPETVVEKETKHEEKCLFIRTSTFRFLLGSHKRAVEAYIEAEKMSDAPDWEIHYSLGKKVGVLVLTMSHVI